MGYRTLIEGNLTKAFKLMKDLAVQAVFTKKTSNTFNFGTGVVSEGTSDHPAKVVFIEDIKREGDTNVTARYIMFQTSDVGDINSFDTVRIGDNTYKIGLPVGSGSLKSNGFTSLVNIY